MKTHEWYIAIPPIVKFDSSPTVVHRATCPVCGRKLVNIYWHNNNWQCSKCKNFDRRMTDENA